MAILVAEAMADGHQVQVYDENAWRPDDPDQALTAIYQADDWDVIATGGLTTTYNSLKRILMSARRECSDALIVAGGGFLTSMSRDMMEMRPEIDIGIVGEAYKTFPDILARVDRGETDWSTCQGTIYRDRVNGQIHLTISRPLLNMEELDRLPYPAWEMFPMEQY